MRVSRARPHPSSGDIVDIHYAHDVIFAIATALQVRIKLILQSLVNTIPKERWMDTDLTFEIPQEKHVEDSRPAVSPRQSHDDARTMACYEPLFILFGRAQYDVFR